MDSLIRSLRRSTLITVVVALLATSLLAGIAVAQNPAGQRGNSDAAALCRGEGYKSLTRQDGTPFASVGECINYAAQNGGVTAIATVAPTPTPAPDPTPTPTPPTSTTFILINDPAGTCAALASAVSLEPGTGYVIQMHVSYNGEPPEVREVEVPTTHLGYYSYRVQWSNIYGNKEIYAYLYEITGDGRVLLYQAGPLSLDDECVAP